MRHLKSYGFNGDELVKVYVSVIRPCIEFCSVVYHSMLTAEQKEQLEHLRQQALKCIFGYTQSYRALREKTGLDTLKDRRECAVLKFAEKCSAGKFCDWFPLRVGREMRGSKRYREDYARCDRLKDSPIFYMRRALNREESRQEVDGR